MAEINDVMIFCATHGKGVSRKSGSPKPYDFASLEYIVKATNVDMPECQISNWGYQAKTIGLKNDPAVIARFANCPLLVPITLVIEFDPQDFTKLLAVDFKTDLPVKDEFGGSAAKDTGKDAKSSEPVSKF